MQQHQHGPQCRHGHGQGHNHGAPQGFANQLQEMPPEQYFTILSKKYKQKKQFFWHEILMGLTIDKFYQKYSLNFMRSLSCQMPVMIIASIEMAISCDWIPLRFKHITSGMFFPILFLLFFNYNVVVGVGKYNQFLYNLITITLALFLTVGLRSSGNLNNEEMHRKSKQIYNVRPYLQNPMMSCNPCSIVKPYRSTHCPMCKVCIPKYTRHSVIFGMCIGAPNQLPSLLFYFFLWLTQFTILYLFITTNTYGIITKFMFYLLNIPLCWMSFTQFANLFILNYWLGITEQELKTWPMLQYLVKVPEKEFDNNMNQGLWLNFVGSLYAFLGISGFQSQNNAQPNPLSFAPIDPTRTYTINWSKAIFYLIPQLPMHKSRAQINEMLQREQPRMIQMFKLQLQFREQVVNESKGEQLNQFQLQQKTAMKMQAHMMKNMAQMQPSTEQQKMIQLQMLTHMKKQFANQEDLAVQINKLHSDLTEGLLTPIEANMKMRQLQQELLSRRMSKMQQKKETGATQVRQKRQQQEDAPMKLADQDL